MWCPRYRKPPPPRMQRRLPLQVPSKSREKVVGVLFSVMNGAGLKALVLRAQTLECHCLCPTHDFAGKVPVQRVDGAPWQGLILSKEEAQDFFVGVAAVG